MIELVIMPLAEAEILEAQARFEDASPDLGDRFNEMAEHALDQIAVFPESEPLASAPFRRLLVRDFPFGIYYTLDGRRAVVHAVLDLRQEQEAIARRLRQR